MVCIGVTVSGMSYPAGNGSIALADNAPLFEFGGFEDGEGYSSTPFTIGKIVSNSSMTVVTDAEYVHGGNAALKFSGSAYGQLAMMRTGYGLAPFKSGTWYTFEGYAMTNAETNPAITFYSGLYSNGSLLKSLGYAYVGNDGYCHFKAYINITVFEEDAKTYARVRFTTASMSTPYDETYELPGSLQALDFYFGANSGTDLYLDDFSIYETTAESVSLESQYYEGDFEEALSAEGYVGHAHVFFASFTGVAHNYGIEIKRGDKTWTFEAVRCSEENKFAVAIFGIEDGDYSVCAYADGLKTEYTGFTVCGAE